MAHEFVKLASFNVRGLGVQSCLKQKNLISDMKKYKIDICSLQETKTQQNIDKELDKYRIITTESSNKYYGCGFIVSPEYKDSIHKYWKVSERISCLQLLFEHRKPVYESEPLRETKLKITIKKTEPKKRMTIINVYAPQTGRLKEKENFDTGWYQGAESYK